MEGAPAAKRKRVTHGPTTVLNAEEAVDHGLGGVSFAEGEGGGESDDEGGDEGHEEEDAGASSFGAAARAGTSRAGGGARRIARVDGELEEAPAELDEAGVEFEPFNLNTGALPCVRRVGA